MYVDMEIPIQTINNYITNCLKKELNDDGLLSDVKSFINIYRDENSYDKTPAVWLYIQDWFPKDEMIINRKNTRCTLTFPVEVACISQKSKLNKADAEATSLQGRVIECFIKNWKRVINEEQFILCTGFRIVRGYADGTREAINQLRRVTIKGVIIEFDFTIDWIKCIKIEENKQNEENTESELNG